MEKENFIKRLSDAVYSNKNEIYFVGMILTIISSVIGFWITYHHFSANYEGQNELANVLMSPFIIAVVYSLIIFFIGSLVITTLTMTHARRMKAFNVEVEFEAWQHNIMKIGQVHYLSDILSYHKQIVGQFNNVESVSFRSVLIELCQRYQEYFTRAFDIQLSYSIKTEEELTHQERQLLSFMENKETTVGFQNRMIGNRTLLIAAAHSSFEQNLPMYLSFLSDSDYEFDDYDVEAIRALIEYADIVLDNVHLVLAFEDTF
ncbi:hypothetical protein [Salibacterium qingdaonense]|uniref:Uncharacterized protein n=1 Tax=Salibacterium qingdaonense TaxID=266892 RepID=A0A1I4LPX2_9BACI|nr:hypothetical protein [Salibacterium qingdaonense]SFL92873.1 hypothetical protein SAMN04488054_10888 [Salibacterium qingdaonense]